MDYCIRKLLGLTEENFITDENWLEIVTKNHETVHKINGTWTSTCMLGYHTFVTKKE